MMTRSQLMSIAKKNNINSHYQEKEYIQHLFLFNLYKNTSSFVFKGGTCLRICYNYMRYSEDLDFICDIDPKEIEQKIQKTLEFIQLDGIKCSILKKEYFESSYTTKIRFLGPLFSGHLESTNTITIDAGFRVGYQLRPQNQPIYPIYPDIDMYFIKCMREEEILAEKIRALHQRAFARDLYDVWSIIKKGVRPKKDLILKKLDEIGKKEIGDLKCVSEREFVDDLKNFVSIVPDYNTVVKEIEESAIFLRN